MVMDDVMNKVKLGGKKVIYWDVSQQLEDLDFADDVCFLSHTFNKMYIYETKIPGKHRKSCWTNN
jgi:hypothetical protein